MSNSATTPPVTPERVFASMNAFQLTQAFRGALELDLFTAIGAGFTDARALALRLNASERGIRILCDFLTVHGLLTKTGDRWGLSPDAALFLNRKSPAFLGDAAQFLNSQFLMDSYNDVAAIVRKGGTIVSEEGTVEAENPIWVNFARNMAPMMAPAAMDIAEILGDGAGSAWKVLDIAAGHGLFGIEIAKKNPRAEVVALDWNIVLEVAVENARRSGVDSRYRTIAGSAFDADFGSGYNLALLTNFLHHFDRQTCVALLKKVHAALKPGGRALALEFVPNDDRVTPPISAAFAFIMLASTKSGDAYTFTELEAMFSEAGFARSEIRDLPRSPERLVISHA